MKYEITRGMHFTIEELETLVCALNSKYNQARMQDINDNVPFRESTKRLGDMCGKPYYALMDALYEQCNNE